MSRNHTAKYLLHYVTDSEGDPHAVLSWTDPSTQENESWVLGYLARPLFELPGMRDQYEMLMRDALRRYFASKKVSIQFPGDDDV